MTVGAQRPSSRRSKRSVGSAPTQSLGKPSTLSPGTCLVVGGGDVAPTREVGLPVNSGLFRFRYKHRTYFERMRHQLVHVDNRVGLIQGGEHRLPADVDAEDASGYGS